MIVDVDTPSGPLKFAAFNDACRWRAETLLTKERCTIGWLDELGPEDVLWDVGANVGGYTVYAAKLRGCRVVAFEPLVSNLYALTANVGINGVADRVQVLPVALSDRDGVDTLYCSSLDIGSSCHSAGAEVSPSLVEKPAKARQTVLLLRGMIAVSQFEIPWPTHIKIDVDGLEHLVVEGCFTQRFRVRSMLIETNWNLREHREMVEQLQYEGFQYDAAQYADAQRKSGPFEGTGEMILRR